MLFKPEKKRPKNRNFSKGLVLKKSVKSKFSKGVSPYFFLILGKLSQKKNRFLILWREKNVFRPEM